MSGQSPAVGGALDKQHVGRLAPGRWPRHAPTVACSMMGLRELVRTSIPLPRREPVPPSAAGPQRHRRGPALPAVWLQGQVSTWSCLWLLESGDSRCESAQPFASVTLDGPLKCRFPRPADGDAGLCAPPECGGSVRESGQSPWQMPGPQHSVHGAAVSTGVTWCHFHPLPGTWPCRTPNAAGWPASA